jgi:hypothetical protein
MTNCILIIDGKPVDLPQDKPWTLTISNKPDAATPVPVKDLAAAIAAAKPGDTIYVGGNYKSKSINVTTPGLTILTVSPTHIEFDPQNEKDAALFVLKAKGFAASDLTVSGPSKSDAATYVARCEGASSVFLGGIKTVASAAGGMGIVFCRGVDGLDVVECETERTTVFSVYASGSTNINKKIRLIDCKFGQTESHNTRFYGVENLSILSCEMDNSASTSGRQCLKVHSGKNVSVQDCVFKGSIRLGRDVNDNPAYTLANVSIERCKIYDWCRTDPGATVRFKDCELTVKSSGFVFHLFDATAFSGVKATYPGGKFANNTQHIVGKVNCTFNGSPI